MRSVLSLLTYLIRKQGTSGWHGWMRGGSRGYASRAIRHLMALIQRIRSQDIPLPSQAGLLIYLSLSRPASFLCVRFREEELWLQPATALA